VALVIPPPLAPGDVVRVIAPSGACARDDLWPGLAWVRSRYRVAVSRGVLARDGYLAGDDLRRRDELDRALADAEAKAIVATRGGYGAMRIIEDRGWTALADRPKWIVGYSDITTLHAMAWRAGIASLHAPNVTSLSRALPVDRAAWIAGLEGAGASRVWEGLRVLSGGRASGVLVGGNLSLLCALAAAGCLWIPKGAILAFEDVAEAPYRIDRMLTSLLLGGYLARVAGFVVGSLERSMPGPEGRTADDVVEQRLRPLGVPLLTGAPFGHGSRNSAFVLGASVRIEDGAVYFS
jgi:muramoyltetrapeptide carboxypeptidase